MFWVKDSIYHAESLTIMTRGSFIITGGSSIIPKDFCIQTLFKSYRVLRKKQSDY